MCLRKVGDLTDHVVPQQQSLVREPLLKEKETATGCLTMPYSGHGVIAYTLSTADRNAR